VRTTVALVLLALVAAPAGGQTTARVSVGVMSGTTLLKDQVVAGTDIVVATVVAPTVAVGLAFPTGAGYRVIVEGQYGKSNINYTEATGPPTNATLGTLARLGLVGMVDGPLANGFRWQLGGGRIFYEPGQRQGIFADDAPSFWLVSAGATLERPLSPALSFIATARYDYHQFTTASLTAHAFQMSQSINRLGIFAGIERRF
jgi:hypothetical protein